MTLRSTARATYHVALDFWGCLRRFVDGKAVNGYDDHMAGVLAEAGRAGQRSGLRVAEALAETERCARETGPTSTPEKHGPGSRPSGPILQRESIAAGATPSPGLMPSAADEPGFTAWLASLDARLAAIQDHLTSAAPGARFTPDAAPESPAPDPGAGAGHPGFPNWCAAEMRQVADILLTADSPFRVGYANDLRHAAMEASGDPGQPRVLWPWSNEDERQK